MISITFDIGVYNFSYLINYNDEKTYDIIEFKNINIGEHCDICKVGRPRFQRFAKKNKTLYCKNCALLESKEVTRKYTIPINKIFENIGSFLSKNPQVSDVDMVFIENQPCLKNPMCGSIANFLYSYYFFKIGQSKIKRIAPSSKMRIIDMFKPGARKEYKSIEESSARYRKMKADSIEVARMIAPQSFLDIFDKMEKKDDISDTLIMSIIGLGLDIDAIHQIKK